VAPSRTQTNRRITFAAAAAMAGLVPAVLLATLSPLIPGDPISWCIHHPEWEPTHFDLEAVRSAHKGHEERMLWDHCFAAHLLLQSDEPPLVPSAAVATYRLTLLPSFSESVIIRVEFGSSASRLVVKVPDENALYRFAPAAPPRTFEAVLPQEVATTLRSRLEEPPAWHRGLHQHPEGKDGTVYVLERNNSGRHEVRSEWSPDVNDPELRGFREAAEAMVATACGSVYCAKGF